MKTKNTNFSLLDSEVQQIQSHLETIENNPLLFTDGNFEDREAALDFIEVHVIGRVNALLNKTAQQAQLITLLCRVDALIGRLESSSERLFQSCQKILREEHSSSNFKELVESHINLQQEISYSPGYDFLDAFVDGIIFTNSLQQQIKELEPEMVYYQKTPARIIFELTEKIVFKKEDVFFDLGSGLGQAVILVNLLTGSRARGIEFEPSFCKYAEECASLLDLKGATFVNTDARHAEITDGTIFFMYTPFNGLMMQEVLKMLYVQSLKRSIKIVTYGPCTSIVAYQKWLSSETLWDGNIYKPAIFTSK